MTYTTRLIRFVPAFCPDNVLVRLPFVPLTTYADIVSSRFFTYSPPTERRQLPAAAPAAIVAAPHGLPAHPPPKPVSHTMRLLACIGH